MRVTLSEPDIISLTENTEEFMLMKKGKEIAELTLRDYQRTFRDFLSVSNNSADYDTLKTDASPFALRFVRLPDSAPICSHRETPRFPNRPQQSDGTFLLSDAKEFPCVYGEKGAGYHSLCYMIEGYVLCKKEELKEKESYAII